MNARDFQAHAAMVSHAADTAAHREHTARVLASDAAQAAHVARARAAIWSKRHPIASAAVIMATRVVAACVGSLAALFRA